MTQEEIDILLEHLNRAREYEEWAKRGTPIQVKDDDYDPWFIDPAYDWGRDKEPETKKVECECGAHKVKDAAHSRWCGLYES